MADEVKCVAVAVCDGDSEGSIWYEAATPEAAARASVVEAINAYAPFWYDYADDFERIIVYVNPTWRECEHGDELVSYDAKIEMLFADVYARMRAAGEVSDG
jgi:hypothetical protein